MAKNIAVFMDGTWNHAEASRETNVYRLYRMADCFAPGVQVCCHIPGVGTDRGKFREFNRLRGQARLAPEWDGLLARNARRIVGGISGYGIADKIKEAYAFLVRHYDRQAGDRVYLFGFSRGGFAARSLAGFINEVGMLMADYINEVPTAYDIYRSGKGRAGLADYLYELGAGSPGDRPIPVYLIGVWDAVGALGLPDPFDAISFNTSHHNTYQLPRNVTHARHALALHELRRAFEPAPWVADAAHQRLKQVWFAGAHADVGGGYDTSSLSIAPLQWMADEAQSLDLRLNRDAVDLGQLIHDGVHHEVRGAFKFAGPSVRIGLRSMLGAVPPSPWHGHEIHLSALRRLDYLQSKNNPYAFRRSINRALLEIDELTSSLAAHCALANDAFPTRCSANRHADHRADLMALAGSAGEMDRTNQVVTARYRNALRAAIIKVALDQGVDTLLCLTDVFEQMFKAMTIEATCEAAIASCETLIEALDAVQESLPNGALERRVDVGKLWGVIGQVVRPQLRADLHEIKERKLKI